MDKYISIPSHRKLFKRRSVIGKMHSRYQLLRNSFSELFSLLQKHIYFSFSIIFFLQFPSLKHFVLFKFLSLSIESSFSHSLSVKLKGKKVKNGFPNVEEFGRMDVFPVASTQYTKYIDNLKGKETGFSISGSYIEFYIVENQFCSFY